MSKHHLAQNAPYADTSVPYGQTKSDIDEMLKEWGAKALRWTETPDSMKGVALPLLEFVFETEVEGVKKTYGVRIKPPLTAKYVRAYGRHGPRIATANKNGSMRLLYWYIKARIEAARFGIEDEFEAFMSHIIHALPNGETSTVGETFEKHPEIFAGMLPSFDIRMPALEDKK